MMMMDLLKSKTSQHHARLHQHPLLKGITKSDYSLASYIKLLRAYHGIYLEFESHLVQSQHKFNIAFDYTQRRKLPWLLADLADLESSPSDACLSAAAIKPLSIATKNHWLGVAYVIEGSTLGSQVIAPCLHHSINISPGFAGRFFHGYGSNTEQYWDIFCEFASADQTDQPDEVIEAASDAFNYFNDGLSYYASSLN